MAYSPPKAWFYRNKRASVKNVPPNAAPAGSAYVITTSGAYVTDNSGAYLLTGA
jgi:hypothetical protein